MSDLGSRSDLHDKYGSESPVQLARLRCLMFMCCKQGFANRTVDFA